MRRLVVHFAMIACAGGILSSCYTASINSNFESARSLKRNNLELAGNYNSLSDSPDFSDMSQPIIGVRIGYGITDNFDLKLRYEILFPSSNNNIDWYRHFLSISPKYTIVDEWLAVKLPINYYFWSPEEIREDVFALNPTLFFTFPINHQFETGIAVNYQHFFEKETSDYYGFCWGFGFSTDLDQWAIRPEIGYQFAVDGTEPILSVGLGLSYNFALGR